MADLLIDQAVYSHGSYFTVPGQVAVCTTHWQLVSELPGPIAQSEADFASALDATLAPLWLPLIGANATYYGSLTRRVSLPGPWARPSPVTINSAVGTGAGPNLPTQTCGLISFHAAKLGRSEQGRLYLPFPYRDANETTGVPTAAYLADVISLGNVLAADYNLIAGGTTYRFQPAIWHALPKNFSIITGYQQRHAWATQKRRGAYGRLNPAPF